MTLFFSFDGRINRGKFWLTGLIFTAAWIAFTVALLVSTAGLNIDPSSGVAMPLWAVGITLILAWIWSSIAIGIKRLHDRDESGWWMLAFVLGPTLLDGIGRLLGGGSSFTSELPDLAIAVWATVELGCLRGTNGPNHYGPDPLHVAHT